MLDRSALFTVTAVEYIYLLIIWKQWSTWCPALSGFGRHLLLLMFADDLALISDSVAGLQKLLNIIYRFCSDRGTIINIVTTKIVVFKKGDMLVRNESWSLGGGRIRSYLVFTYPGVNFTRELSLIQMAKRKMCYDFYFNKKLSVLPTSERGVLQEI